MIKCPHGNYYQECSLCARLSEMYHKGWEIQERENRDKVVFEQLKDLEQRRKDDKIKTTLRRVEITPQTKENYFSNVLHKMLGV